MVFQIHSNHSHNSVTFSSRVNRTLITELYWLLINIIITYKEANVSLEYFLNMYIKGRLRLPAFHLQNVSCWPEIVHFPYILLTVFFLPSMLFLFYTICYMLHSYSQQFRVGCCVALIFISNIIIYLDYFKRKLFCKKIKSCNIFKRLTIYRNLLKKIIIKIWI